MGVGRELEGYWISDMLRIKVPVEEVWTVSGIGRLCSSLLMSK